MMLFNNIPLFIQASFDKENYGLPKFYDFNLFFDNELKMFRQKSNFELEKLLNEIYKKGSLADGSISSESGKIYFDRVIKYLCDNFEFKENSKVLEIGVGLGVVIKKLKNTTKSIFYGIEPGEFVNNSEFEGINILNDFFPSYQLTEKFDLIYSLLVLEHIIDPLNFLNELDLILNKNGKIILAVPNCEPYLLEGDISIFIHEHFSYFTKDAIIQLINKSIFFIEDISIIEGSFYFTISRENTVNFSKFLYDSIDYSSFQENVEKLKNGLVEICKIYNQCEIAIYCPIRALNFLYNEKLFDVRLIDDNSDLKDKYLPSLNSKIESFTDICINPPKLLVIYSRTFGKRIKTKCNEVINLAETKIICLEDLI